MQTPNLRGLVTVIGREIATRPGASADDLLTRSWTELVRLLALGSEPTIRYCPSCGGLGMRAATRCCHCWARLTPEAASGT